MNTTEQVVADLKDAREIVRTKWCPRGLTDGKGNVCIVGALNIVTSGNVHHLPVSSGTGRREQAYCHLMKHMPKSGELANYNDDPATTHEDIMMLFDKALADLGAL